VGKGSIPFTRSILPFRMSSQSRPALQAVVFSTASARVGSGISWNGSDA
jgi:hypothetical protein